MKKTLLTYSKYCFFNKQTPAFLPKQFNDTCFDIEQLEVEYFSCYQLIKSNSLEQHHYFKIAPYFYYLNNILLDYYIINELHSYQSNLKKQLHALNLLSQEIEHPNSNTPSTSFLPQLRLVAQHTKAFWKSSSQINNFLGWLNAKRSQFGYHRAFSIQIVHYAQSVPIKNLFDQLNKLIQNRFTLSDSLQILDILNQFMLIAATALYLLRFSIQFYLLLKHLILSMKNKSLSISQVLNRELEKRFFILTSDFIWSLANFAVIYQRITHVSAPWIPLIILIFLILDVALLASQYVIKRSTYATQLSLLSAQELQFESAEDKYIIRNQIQILNNEWAAQKAYFYFNIIAALLIASFFALSLLTSGPILITFLTFFSMVGNAMYNSAAQFKAYRLASAYARQDLQFYKPNSPKLKEAQLQYAQCQKEFIYSMIKNSLLPSLGITLFILCYPVAITLFLITAALKLAPTTTECTHYKLFQSATNSPQAQIFSGSYMKNTPTTSM